MTAIVTTYAAVTTVAPHVVVDDGIGIVAVCTHPTVAARIAELWERHGLTDVPDDCAGVMA